MEANIFKNKITARRRGLLQSNTSQGEKVKRYIVLVLAMFLAIGCTKKIEISDEVKSEIIRISDQMVLASENKDVNGVVKYFDQNIKIEIIRESGDNQIFDLNSYKNYLENVLPMLESYSYVRKEEQIFGLGTRNIIFKMRVEEKYTHQGKEKVSTFEEEWNVVGRKGELKIINIRFRPDA